MFSMPQIQWLIHFMRNLPGQNAPHRQVAPEEYEHYMQAQREQAEAQAASQESSPEAWNGYADADDGGGYEDPSAWDYAGEQW